ncbi:restriction endonuclease subunit M [Rodentibacter caecimuris]|nr:restriction endonuclease subunit M [Rodentibacter heylii]
MLTKEYIQLCKKDGNIDTLIHKNMDNIKNISFILENLGYLSSSFNYESIEYLMNSDSEKVRSLVIKNLSKINNTDLFLKIKNYFLSDISSLVRRECISAIGRMRKKEHIPFLISILQDEDPKIASQAIRGLLVFKGDYTVDMELKRLKLHKNEMIKKIINKEYFSSENKDKKNFLSHSHVHNYLKNVIVNSDVLEVFKLIKDESFHLTFTSPPYYNARDYSIYSSYDDYLDFLENVFLETYRTTKEGRFLIVNTSPIIIPRISRSHSSKRYPIPFDLHNRLTKIGWEFVDDIVWMKPEYSVKNRIGGFQQHRKPLAYKPNSVTEYLMVYRKSTDKLLDWNMKQYSADIINKSKVVDGFETTNVWQINPKSDKVHSAVFPAELCKRVIEYYSYKGDVIFDPFAGSGTLGRTAKYLDRYFFLTEKDEKYFKYMKMLQQKDMLSIDKQTKFLTLIQFKGLAYENN